MTRANGNAADRFIDRHRREGQGERLAVTDPLRRLAYGEPVAMSARFAAGLRAAKLATFAWYSWRTIRIGQRAARDGHLLQICATGICGGFAEGSRCRFA